MDDKIFTKLAAIPILALFLGVAILAGRIALDWNQQNTQFVIGSLVATCGGGLALMATIIGLLIGLALYRRIQARPEQPAAPPGVTIGGYPVLPYRESLPPQLTAGSDRLGSWSSNGVAGYDLWEEQPARPERGGGTGQ